MNDADEVGRVIAEHSKSFALASKLLAPAARAYAVAVYAWCRRADDAVDLADRTQAAENLVRLRHELDAVYAGESQRDPILAAFQTSIRERKIPRHYADELLAGMEMDLTQTRYETFDDLLLYCYRVAGVVGLTMCHVLGVRGVEALVHAAHLGAAMQLTNIARDVAEDWQRGRLYIPLAWLDEHARSWAETADSVLDRTAADRLCTPVRRLLDAADRLYLSGDRGLPMLGPRSAIAVATARRVYSAIGGVIRAKNYDVLSGRAYLGKWRKIQLAVRSLTAGMSASSIATVPEKTLDFQAFHASTQALLEGI